MVAVNPQGRITLPVHVRRQLGLSEGTQLEVRVEGNTLQLRRATLIPDEDRWAYAPAAIASLKRALSDMKAGLVYELGPADLESGRYPRTRRRPRSGRVR